MVAYVICNIYSDVDLLSTSSLRLIVRAEPRLRVQSRLKRDSATKTGCTRESSAKLHGKTEGLAKT